MSQQSNGSSSSGRSFFQVIRDQEELVRPQDIQRRGNITSKEDGIVVCTVGLQKLKASKVVQMNVENGSTLLDPLLK